jgi:hypothetical protein
MIAKMVVPHTFMIPSLFVFISNINCDIVYKSNYLFGKRLFVEGLLTRATL